MGIEKKTKQKVTTTVSSKVRTGHVYFNHDVGTGMIRGRFTGKVGKLTDLRKAFEDAINDLEL